MNRPSEASLKLSTFFPYRLSVLANRVSALIARLYTERFAISVPQWRVIAVLGEEGGISAKEVAERTAMDKVAVSRAVRGLADKGHLRRRASRADARVAHLTLTSSGVGIYEEIAPLARDCERRILEAIGREERRLLEEAFDRLLERVGELENNEEVDKRL